LSKSPANKFYLLHCIPRVILSMHINIAGAIINVELEALHSTSTEMDVRVTDDSWMPGHIHLQSMGVATIDGPRTQQ